MFDPTFARNLAAGVKREEGKSLNDPWCIGYFVDNELHWSQEHSLGEWTLLSGPDQPAKVAMVRDLQQKYDTIAALNGAWETDYASWDALLQSQQAPSSPGARQDQEAFHRRFAEQYYSTVRDVLKEHAPNQLYLGSRIHTRNEGARQAAAKYCDVVSYNIYRLPLERAIGEQDAPVIISEYGVGATDRGHF